MTLFLTAFSIPQSSGINGWVIDRSSKLSIAGSSNINSFICDITEYVNPDTLHYEKDLKAKRLLFRNSSLSVDVKRFDCHQNYITGDFRKMLKADKYPAIRISFISLDEPQESGNVRGQVEIELAGQKKIMEIMYRCTYFGNNQVHLEGTKAMKFSDFNLEAPRKLAGLIRINEEINVSFQLFFRKIIQ